MSENIVVATEQEIKTEEQTSAYIPAEYVSVVVDKLAEEYIKGVYAKWLTSQGAKVANIAKQKEEAEAKISTLKTGLTEFIAKAKAEMKKLAKVENYAGIALKQAEIVAEEKRVEKEIDRINKVPGTNRTGTGELTANKLNAAEIRKNVAQFSFKGSAFLVAHSSIVSMGVLAAAGLKQPDSDAFVAWPVDPVETEKDNGRKYTKGQPVIKGQPVKLVVQPGERMTVLSHSAYSNGVAGQLKAKGLISIGEKTAYQPYSCDATVSEPKYDWLVDRS